jgi:hypothetical protein
VWATEVGQLLGEGYGVTRASVLAVALMLASACSSTSKQTTATTTTPLNNLPVSQPFAESTKPRLSFVGDSITVESAADINAHFQNRYNVAIYATVGRDTYLEAAVVAQ